MVANSSVGDLLTAQKPGTAKPGAKPGSNDDASVASSVGDGMDDDKSVMGEEWLAARPNKALHIESQAS